MYFSNSDLSTTVKYCYRDSKQGQNNVLAAAYTTQNISGQERRSDVHAKSQTF